MRTALARLATAVQYQFALALGLALLPVATLAHRLGVTLPLQHVLERSEAAYRDAR